MTTMEILWSCIGLVICSVVVSAVAVAIMMVVWHLFKTDMDIQIESEKWEEEQ